MNRPKLPGVHTTTWAVADMDVVAVVEYESRPELGKDVHGLIYTGLDQEVPVVFLVTSDRHIKRLQSLAGTTVAVSMIGYFDDEGCFEPDTLSIKRVSALKDCWFSPRARTT